MKTWMHPFQRRSDGRAKPFFGKREPEPFQRHTTPANGLNTLAPGSAQRWAAPAGGPHGRSHRLLRWATAQGSKLTVGPNIKLKGVEDHRLRHAGGEGTVETTMDSRVIHISKGRIP